MNQQKAVKATFNLLSTLMLQQGNNLYITRTGIYCKKKYIVGLT